MATVPIEQVVHRAGIVQVAIAKHDRKDAPAELFWQSTQSGTTVTLDKAVDTGGGGTDQTDIEAVIARLDGTADLVLV